MQRLEIEVAEGIGHIWLNRPEKRNALDRLLVDELYQAATDFHEDERVRVVVLGGRGPAFCAGADLAYLRAMSTYTLEENGEDSAALARTMHAIYALPKPTIARVHGAAIAGGCGLATVCDVVIASEAATFGYSEVRIGFVPAIVMAFLIRKAQAIRVRELLLSGRIVGADEAYARGLVSEVVSGGETALDDRVAMLARTIADASPSATQMTKQLLTTLEGMPLEAALEHAARTNAIARMTPDCQAGIARFLNKTTS